MNTTDSITRTAVLEKTLLRINNREVIPLPNGNIQVFLHGKPILTIRGADDTVDINGTAMMTKKSSRLINSILSLFTDYKVTTRNGNWFLISPTRVFTPFSGKTITVDMTNNPYGA